MGKKKKKKQKSRKKPVSTETLQNAADAHMRAGRYRQARSLFGQLCKQNRDKYLSELIESCRCLFHLLMDQGKFRDAKAVLTSLENITDRPKLYLEAVRLALAEENYSQAANIAAEALAGRKPPFTESESLMGDALIVAFENRDRSFPLSPPLLTDISRVHSSLDAVAQERYAEALSLIQPMGTRSLFSPWKWFIKGICAFYAHDDARALKALEKIFPGTVPGKAAQAFLTILKETGWLATGHKKFDLLGDICCLAGDENLADCLPRSEYLWRVGRYRDSYKHLRSRLDGFPSQKPGIQRSLSTFYFNAITDTEDMRSEKYFDFLFDLALQKGKKNSFEKMQASRALALSLETDPYADRETMQEWRSFLFAYQQHHGRNKRVEAAVYAHLGDVYSMEDMAEDTMIPFFFFRQNRQRPELRNETLAETCYQKALLYCPDNLKTHFSLLELYEKTRQKAEANRKLDDIIKRFPDEKESLYKAGLQCLKRNALIKGLKYLEQALSLDPLDSMLRTYLIIACVKAGLMYAQKGAMEKCRDLLAKALEKAQRQSEDFTRGQAYLFARWAIFEWLAGNEEEGAQFKLQAFELCGHELKLHCFLWLIGHIYEVPDKYLKEHGSVLDGIYSGQPASDPAEDLVETFGYIRQIPSKHSRIKRETARLNSYLRKVLGKGVSRKVAVKVIEYGLEGTSDDQGVARKYTAKMLKLYPDDAEMRMFRYLSRQQLGMDFRNPERSLKELRIILDLAEKQEIRDLVPRVRQAIKETENALSLMESFGMPTDDDWFDDDEEEDFGPFFPPAKRGRGSKKRSSNSNSKSAPSKQDRHRQLDLFE